MNGQTTRLESLEGLRFLSSIAIVAGHYVPYVAPQRWISKLHLAVDLFFVISGIVIAERYAGEIRDGAAYSRFLLRRIARLYPLHLATLGFYVAIGLMLWQGHFAVAEAEKYNPAAIVPNLLLVHAWLPSGTISFNYVSWSISAEFFVYLLFPLIGFLVARGFRLGLAGILVTLLATVFLSEYYLGQHLTRLGWTCGILRALPSFAFGVWLSLHARRLDGLSNAARTALPLLLALIAILLVVRPHDYLILPLIWLLVAAAFLCDRAGRPTALSAPLLSNRGELTYSLYMLHTVVATIFLGAIFPRLLGGSLEARIVSLLLSTIILYAVASLSLRFFETPMRRAITRIGDAILRPSQPLEPRKSDVP